MPFGGFTRNPQRKNVTMMFLATEKTFRAVIFYWNIFWHKVLHTRAVFFGVFFTVNFH
jgi:hypothetical protein